MGISFRVIPSSYHEKKIPGLSPALLVRKHAEGKVRKISAPKKYPVLGADTVVVLKGKIMGKPKSQKEALKMLRALSGRRHFVYTGIALRNPETGKIKTAFEKTAVEFKKLAEKDILNYLDAVHVLDKAGAYAIQEGPKIVKKIKGSYSNVVGLPVELLKRLIRSSRTAEGRSGI